MAIPAAMSGTPRTMSDNLEAVAATTLNEIARAISELGFRRQPGELAWPHLEPEMKTLAELVRRCAERMTARGGDDFYTLAALLILDGMVAQHLHELRVRGALQ